MVLIKVATSDLCYIINEEKVYSIQKDYGEKKYKAFLKFNL